jgi:hypothetical protein
MQLSAVFFFFSLPATINIYVKTGYLTVFPESSATAAYSPPEVTNFHEKKISYFLSNTDKDRRGGEEGKAKR